MEAFPFLTIITFAPVVGAIVLLLLPPESRMEDQARIDRVNQIVKILAVVFTGISLVLSLIVYVYINQQYGPDASVPTQEAMFFLEDGPIEWVPQIGITYHMGVDGISAPMLLLTG
ncbi:MAG: hypothetical protein ACFB51_18295, partial [Anaerolineae bacterium]